MSDSSQNVEKLAWQTLQELTQAVKTVADVYVRTEVIGGHYMRVSSEDFMDALRGMRAAAPAHPRPVRFKFTIDSGIVWVHSSLEAKSIRLAKREAELKRAAALLPPPPPPAGYLRSHRTTGALQFSINPLTEAEKVEGWIERPFWTAPPGGAVTADSNVAPADADAS